VEVICGEKTKEETADIVFQVAESVGKKPILVKKDAPGFALNRIQFAVLREARHIVESGIADMADVDKVLKYGLGSRLFDDEGIPSRQNVVIDHGVLKTYLCDCYSARKLGFEPTGSATRGVTSNPSSGTSNFYMQNGTISPEEIITSVKNGLYLTSVDWVGINYVTGDYSRGASGIWIENGKLTYPVQEFTVAGNMLDMMQNITMIGNDLEFRNSIAAPTFKMKEMTISGS